MDTRNVLENIADLTLPLFALLLGKDAWEEELLEEYQGYTHRQLFAFYQEGMAKADSRYLSLRKLAGGSAAALVLDCAVACFLHPDLTELLAKSGLSCCMSLAIQAGVEEDYMELQRQYRSLSAILPADRKGFFMRDVFHADERLVNHIARVDLPVRQLERLVELYPPKETLQALYVNQTVSEQVEGLLLHTFPLQLAGENGSGKRLLLRHALKKIDRWGIFADLRILCQEDNVSELLWLLYREALLLEGAVCLYGIDAEWQRQYGMQMLPVLLKLFRDVPLCLCTSVDLNLAAGETGDFNRLALPALNRDSCIALWQGYCEQFGVEGQDYRLLGTKYRLTPAQIAKATRRIAEMKKPTDQLLLQACIEVQPTAGANIRQMNVQYTFDDLKIPSQTREILDSICAHVNHREKVYGQWGLDKRYAYGKSVSALFSGRPGTGKTMAVQVISSALSIPLYAVNLSQIVDKYVGETEKKLEEVFALAERSNTILFFDEADSLFGKRSEVNDSKDRYANMEVSYILQRLEQYDGIVILATNHRENIDDAFLRRIRYIAEFPMPNEELRREIWKGCFAQETPLLEIDWDFIARQFEFSGGDIKNVALNAVFLAAQEGDAGIDMSHILQSIRMEYQKTNRILSRDSLGEYAYLIFER